MREISTPHSPCGKRVTAWFSLKSILSYRLLPPQPIHHSPRQIEKSSIHPPQQCNARQGKQKQQREFAKQKKIRKKNIEVYDTRLIWRLLGRKAGRNETSVFAFFLAPTVHIFPRTRAQSRGCLFVSKRGFPTDSFVPLSLSLNDSMSNKAEQPSQVASPGARCLSPSVSHHQIPLLPFLSFLSFPPPDPNRKCNACKFVCCIVFRFLGPLAFSLSWLLPSQQVALRAQEAEVLSPSSPDDHDEAKSPSPVIKKGYRTTSK
ncbi:hypothetical protein B0T22DRAFT_244528 [Podospora appendiculata]|uniref:Uncharacterized protein n=1 Tax=Podospora appendiculata TaxID=314037 RepID=A0AAE0X215_9PEZI|nr:hypothetical protein B0T22DRAFT_244528 [Podospora appendiculata]